MSWTELLLLLHFTMYIDVVINEKSCAERYIVSQKFHTATTSHVRMKLVAHWQK